MPSREAYFRPLFAAFLSFLVACAAQQVQSSSYGSGVPCPFWLSPTMEDESVLFIQSGDGPPKASLLFQPTRILKVCDSSGEVIYSQDRDFAWKPGSQEITLLSGSRVVFKTPQELRRPAKSQPYVLTHRDGMGEILFGGGHEYHDMQTVVTYEHAIDAWAGPVPTFASDQLPHTIKKLSQEKALTIALLGDSISTGCNSSGWAKTAPFQPAYQDLFAKNLEAAYSAKVVLKNFSVGGTDTAWGLTMMGKVIDATPDLLILAFGMNDCARRPAKEYQDNIRAMVDAVRKACPNSEVVLVASMVGNADWTALRQERFPQYRDALEKLTQPGVALADMTSFWIEMLKYKKDWDLTGNGVNHPNDFGHRVYAQVLSSLLIRYPSGEK